ncbi:MAG: glycosyltransferase family 4 protein [Parcubacteria group bacterium]|nr:glycosyltransferase family 4 protein [Parcubacteria group bacterium]MBI4268469.1 glycosyltransferase family 4 protein [Candidatus Uhrbacteria bacterium]
MKRVALFSVTYDPFIGGAEVAIKEVTNRLEGYEFDLFTARLNVRLPRHERIGNVNVYRVGSGRSLLDKWLYPWRAARLALRKHVEKPYDIIHAVLETYAGFAALLFKRRCPSVPYLLTLQSGDPDEFINKRTWFWKKTYAQIYTKTDKITAISTWLSKRAQKYGARVEDIVIIPNAVDERFFQEVSEERQREIRKSWGIKENEFVVITTSRLVRKNGIDILIDAMEHVPEQVKLVIAGTGKDEQKLKAQAEKFGNRVLFLGHVSHESLPELLWSSDAFVRPSRSEGLGNSFLEATAAGLAVIGAPVGGIKDLIKEGIVEAITENNARGVAKKINDIRSQPHSYKDALQPAGRDVVKRQFSWNVIARQYEDEYQKLINQAHVPAR